MREVHADPGIPERRHEMPERQRKVRNRHPRLDMPHRRAQEDLAIDHRPSSRPRCGAGVGSSTAVCAFVHPGEVKRARLIVRQKKSWARPAWPIDTGAGRSSRTVMPPRRPWRMTAPSAVDPKLADPAARIDLPRPDRQDDRQEADRAGDHPVAVLVEDPADHLLEREREHELAVGVRPVRHRQSGIGARDHAAGGNQEHRRGDDELDESVEPDHGVVALKAKPTVLVSFSPSVTLCVCVPSFSCHASIV